MFCDDYRAQGGIRVTVKAIETMLKSFRHEVFVGNTPKSGIDLFWIHHLNDNDQLTKIMQFAEAENVPVWFQEHDFRDVCLTGRKAIGRMGLYGRINPCSKEFSSSCFFWHAGVGCGRGKNPFKLYETYKNNTRRLRWILSSDKVIVYSSFMKEVFTVNGVEPDRIIIPKPFHADFSRQASIFPRTSPTLMWAGRMVPEKGMKLFLNSAALIQKKIPNLKILLLGDGPWRPDVQAYAKKTGLRHVEITGWLDSHELHACYRAATVLMITSLWPEPFGLIGIEAAAQGTPVVAIATGGIRDWCLKEDGFIPVEQCTPEALATATVPLFEDIDLWRRTSAKVLSSYKAKYGEIFQKKSLNDLLMTLKG
jgi:glycosyltransferase involved in cell wall biosynthesis